MAGAAQDPVGQTVPSEQASAASDPVSQLTSPGGKGHLQRNGDALVAEDGRRYVIEHGIVRMLDEVDRGLEAELEAQQAAMEIYLDERLLLMRNEHNVARLVVEELLGHTSGAVLDAGCGVGLLGR